MRASITHNDNVIIFACENSAEKAITQAGDGEVLSGRRQLLRVPCSGKVQETHMLRAIEGGFSGVLLLGCHEDNCHYLQGSQRCEKRVLRTRELLTEIGLEKDRIQFHRVAVNEGDYIKEIVEDFIKDLEQLDE